MQNTSSLPKLLLSVAIAVPMAFTSCSLHPQAWNPPSKPAFAGSSALNEKLSTSSKVAIDGWFGPEDIIFDQVGSLYCGVHNSSTVFQSEKMVATGWDFRPNKPMPWMLFILIPA